MALAPHAKTHMSPQLVARQLAAGAWGLTAAVPHQVAVLLQFGMTATSSAAYAPISDVETVEARQSTRERFCGPTVNRPKRFGAPPSLVRVRSD